MAKVSIFSSLLGGQILVRHGGLWRHWKFILYLFFLAIIYISFRFMVKDTMLKEVKNEEILQELRFEHTNKMTDILSLSKRGEVERMLKEHNSTLVPPEYPPLIISEE